MAWRAAAHRLAVTTEMQAKNTEPFLPLGRADLAGAWPASRAMAGQEPSGEWALRRPAASVPVACLPQWSQGLKCPGLVSPHGCHTCSCDRQG